MELVILSAFNGRLRSEPMEWPDTPPNFRVPIEQTTNGFYMGKDMPLNQTHDYAIFTRTDQYWLSPNGYAAVYEMTEYPFGRNPAEEGLNK